MEQGVGLALTAKQPSIIAHPLGPSERGGLHVVGSVNNGDAKPLYLLHGLALVRTDDDGVGL